MLYDYQNLTTKASIQAHIHPVNSLDSTAGNQSQIHLHPTHHTPLDSNIAYRPAHTTLFDGHVVCRPSHTTPFDSHNFQLRDQPHVVRRQVMREFGIRFTQMADEAVDSGAVDSGGVDSGAVASREPSGAEFVGVPVS